MIANNFKTTFVFAAAFSALSLAVGPSQAAAIFINEIHYDNASIDTGEAIEMAGLASTDLSGASLAFYNGATGTVYKTVALSGIIPDQSAGFGTLAFSVSGIQNGPGDGIALIDGGNVVEFLSYEGTLTAVNGPAAGMMSIDIGVAESSSTAVGKSLQLVGPGLTPSDFTWAPASSSTFDAINTNQTFLTSLAIPTELFFSEYVEGESFVKALEIANFTGSSIDLGAAGYEIDVYHNGRTTPTFNIDLSGVIASEDVFVAANPNAGVSNADAFFGNILFNGDDAVVLTRNGIIIDVIGQIGFDPGARWGSGSVSTKDTTLQRKDLIFAGDANGLDAFDPLFQWLGLPVNTISGLGSHSIRTAVPEPPTLALFVLAVVGMALPRNRWSQRPAAPLLL